MQDKDFKARLVREAFYPLVNLTPIQKMLYHDQRRFLFVSSGRRSRKTLIFKRKMLNAAIRKPGKYFHGAPTLQQAREIFWEELKRTTRHIRSDISETYLYVVLKNKTKIQVAGLDKPQRIEGRPWDGFHITEAPDLKPQAYEENLLPLIADTDGFAWMDGVPNGKDSTYYPLCLEASGGTIPRIDPALRGAIGTNKEKPDHAYYLWLSSTVLTDQQLAVFKSMMDERTFRQEFEGSFEGAGGLAYYSFGDHNLADIQRDHNRPVYIGMDFNVDPMTCTLCHVDEQARTVHQWGEIYLTNSNTFEMSDEICRVLGIRDGRGVTIIPDATGQARTSNSTESDLAILRRAGFDVWSGASNPRQRDRLAAVNSMMKSADGKVHYLVNPRACPRTIKDFNRVELLPDGRIDKRKEGQGIGHISDALGYLINYFFPVRQREAGGI